MRAQGTTFVLSSTAIFVAVVVACNSLSGLDELTLEQPAADASTTVDVRSSEADAAMVRDANSPIVEPPKACPAAGRRCVHAAPSGWTGPLAVFASGEGDKGAPTCPASLAVAKVDGHEGDPKGALTCSPCTCGAPDTSCSATLIQHGDNACTNTTKTTALTTTVCEDMLNGTDSLKVLVNASATSCPAAGGVAARDPVTWPTSVVGCGAPELLTSGCAADEVCAPDPPATFRPKHCISQAGDVACPAPWTDKLSVSTGVNDTRKCPTCSCQAPAGVACTGTARFSAPSLACNSVATVNIPITCTTTGAQSSWKLLTLTPSAGGCAPQSTPPQPGSLAKEGPVTVCCEP